jgi:hypothetical protein
MQTGGHGNDGLMMVVPIGVAVVVGVILLGGPANALEAINSMVRDLAYQVMALLAAWF